MASGGGEPPFPTVDKCDASRLGPESTVAADLDGTLLRSRSAFPYYAVVAFETGGAPRLALLLLLVPLAAALSRLVSGAAGTRVLVLAATAGARVADVESAARAVLPRFYAADVHPAAWRVFAACGGRRLVLTATPRVMAEPFLRGCLGADDVAGTELATWRGRATGWVDARRGVLVGERKAEALKEMVGHGEMPDVGLGDGRSDYAFMGICKEAYLVPRTPVDAVRADKLPKRIVFHDGRLVQRPTPLVALLTLLWFPVGILLSLVRVAVGVLLPMPWLHVAFHALGVRVVVRGAPPPPPCRGHGAAGRTTGVLFACCHRTLLDAIFLSVALRRPVAAVTYSLSRLSEFLSPIRTVRLTRDRATDAATIKNVLSQGDLAICPEGTTCREPFLLRFSALFAELTDDIVPVAMECRMTMFHGTTARGWKGMDPFYFFMNPSPVYTVTFLDKLPPDLTCGGGKSSHEVANSVQNLIASTLSYQCTSFTRKDKYRELADNDGVVHVNTEKKRSAETYTMPHPYTCTSQARDNTRKVIDAARLLTAELSAMKVASGESFPAVDKCDVSRLGSQSTVVSDLDGTLLRSRSAFPYYALVAFDTGGVLRLALLLLLAPLAAALYHLVSESAGVRVLIFAATAGARVADIGSAARAVLPKFYAEDVHPAAWHVFAACGRKLVITATPRLMAEPFLRECLGADAVAGTELATWRGRATGWVDARRGVLVGERKAEALREMLVGDGGMPDVELGDRRSDYAFMNLCKEAYLVPRTPVDAVRADKLPKRIVFHDGRLVRRPTPLVALLTLLWFPVGILLSLVRVAVGVLLPMPWLHVAFHALGVRVVVRGAPPPPPCRGYGAAGRTTGVLFACCHRTLLDMIFLSVALGRPVAAVTYSLSRLSEFLSPIRTVRLTRDRATDAATFRSVLSQGDLVICPEGTTCREPFLLRFSALFAELTEDIVPVAMECRMTMCHGTTARGWKGMDTFYFFMNPSPVYTITFVDKLPADLTCGGGKSSHELEKDGVWGDGLTGWYTGIDREVIMAMEAASCEPFLDVAMCDASRLSAQSTVVSDLDGTLLRSRSAFPYYALVAFEIGGVLRLALLVLLAPLATALYHLVSEAAGVRVLIFAATAGARVADVKSAARAVLPKFYAEDVHPAAWRVFAACGRRLVITATPRVMAEPFLRDCLGADAVAGTELATWRGRATGWVDARRGVIVGERKADALREMVGDGEMPDVALGDRSSDYAFMSLCKEACLVPRTPVEAVPVDKLPKRIIFHDGRLVQRPTPLVALLTLLWFPIGFLLSLVRVAAALLLPMSWLYVVYHVLGVRAVVKGAPPPRAGRDAGRTGVLFACSHRTVLDAVAVSVALRRPVATLSYSVSRLSEFLSPIRTARLTRDRATDAVKMRRVLAESDIVICPEGTTSREPFLLRFSALFAELTDDIVPVAIGCRTSMFHGTTARGWKGLDPFYFLMNPTAVYMVTFLDKLPPEHTCGGGKSSHEVANYVQKLIGSTLSYECTTLTRKDKYRELAGNDGVVAVNTAKKRFGW
ncbi:Glycerol-3-phosphate 2-O-acyltransferase 6 [Dichanthelium oligosanthes]|uniref:Glycerol-3-phosphate 2-O-acyltransferase 6 n=1 Tax=Dichanthelium oligosanthes TaxID=888268 RepID=A0A1E5VE50_9POAL|nr:Glycerol-3-phosphate 2-O-acyltransferase 6 [Dichanthelium oligosanthes]